MGIVVNNINRRRAVELFVMPDHCCATFAKATFCPLCSTAQVHRELTVRSMFPGGVCAKAPDTPQAQEMNGMGPSSQPPPPPPGQQQGWSNGQQQQQQQQQYPQYDNAPAQGKTV
jgi:hypothetical protein